MTVASHRQHKQFDLLTFEEVGSLNEAEQLKESMLKVEKEHLGLLDEGNSISTKSSAVKYMMKRTN